jgi:hypothetical protein
MTGFRHTPDMGEISGFGGGYEKCCQDMLEAGCEWLQENKGVTLTGSEFKNVFGLFTAESDDAKAMEKVVLQAAAGEATGAMHHTVMQRLFFINKNGWDEYCRQLREKKNDD